MYIQLLALLNRGGKLIVFALVLTSVLFVTTSTAVEVCKFTYKGTPEELTDTTIKAPDDMVAMSEYIYVGQPSRMDTTVDTPSIFFIIDNSGSMKSVADPRDRDGNRYTVTSAFIDTIQNKFTKAEVGISVFGTWLFFDPADRNYFVTCPNVDSGAYVPLLELDRTYPNYSNKTGYQILKEILDTAVYTGNYGDYVDLQYQPTDSVLMGTSTHINACFEAAKHAFLTSMNAGRNEKHYVIFLSDGDATYPNDNTQDDFEQGTGVATTFTVFFTRTGGVPGSISRMTTNIRNNGYSTSNPGSDYWGFQNTTFDSLMIFLMQNVFTAINKGITSTPSKITIGGISATNWDSTGFTFNNLFPLTGRTTTFNYNITYKMYNASNVYIKDTTHIISNFNVEIDPSSGNLPDTFDVLCWDRNLHFRFNNQNITAANETMTQLGLRFDNKPQQANYNYTNAKVEVTHALGSAKDKETFTLTGSNNDFTIQFSRDIDSTPTPGNQILEHNAFDTLIATFRNSESPQLPLDTLRIAIPFILGDPVTIYQAEYYDLKHGSNNGADGLIDKVLLKVNQTVTQAQINELNNNKDLIVLPTFRNFTKNNYSLESGDIALHVTQDSNTVPVTNVTDQDNLEVKFIVFNGGGYLSPATMKIVDKVAPVINTASLIDHQDSSKIDSLTIIFSEPVSDVKVPRPFQLYGTSGGGVSYFCDVSTINLNNEKGLFRVEGNFTGGVKKIEVGDSIRIEEATNVVDKVNNYQAENNNIRREIGVEFKLNPFVIDLIAINPFSINDLNPNNIIDPDIINQINNIDPNIIPNIFQIDPINGNYYGMIIQVIPDSIQNLDPRFEMEGVLAIYDAVGNQIIGDKEMVKYNKTLLFIWNGQNANNRNVGMGTYLAVCSITSYPLGPGDGKPVDKYVKRRLLGVKD